MLLDYCLSCCARSAPCKSVKISALRRKLWKSMLITTLPQSTCHNSTASAAGVSLRKTFLGSPWRTGSTTPRNHAHGVANRSCSYEATASEHSEIDEKSIESSPPTDWASLAHALLKHLSLTQMESLCEAVERALSGHSECIHIKGRFVQLGRHGEIDLAQLVCRLWRWPDADPSQLIVNFCDPEETVKFESDKPCCINPYHWSMRLDLPSSTNDARDDHPDDDSGKLPVSGLTFLDVGRFGDTKDGRHPSTEDSALASSITASSTEHFNTDFYIPADGDFASTSINNNNEEADEGIGQSPPIWCSLSYWELLTHVGGRWFPVRSPTLHLVSDFSPSPPSRLDLGALQSRTPPVRQPTAPLEPDSQRCVSRTRRRIGAGLVLVRRGTSVWLHNRSPAPVFVSPQCRLAPSGDPTISCVTAKRLPSGCALKLFDLELWTRWPKPGRGGTLPLAPPGPVDPRVVHVSFGKGWGHNYKRQDITLCPCRMEILFHLPPHG